MVAVGALATRGRVSMAPRHSVPEGPMQNDAPKRVGILRVIETEMDRYDSIRYNST